MTTSLAVFAAAFAALYTWHHIGDYWLQTDHQAAHKGDAGWAGRIACLRHVGTYVLGQGLGLALVAGFLDMPLGIVPGLLALAVSGVTHYLADRRSFGLMFAIIAWLEPITGKASFMKLGVPRAGVRVDLFGPCDTCGGKGTSTDESTGGKCWDCRGGGELPVGTVGDLPSLGTGSWALDQSWHIALGVFLPALIIGAFAS
jgi:hypothetical protein